MLKDKPELEPILKPAFTRIIFNKEKLNELTAGIREENGVPETILMDIINGRITIKDTSDFLLFLLLNKLSQKHVREFFTENEINYFSTEKYITEEFQFPIELNCFQVTVDQWIGTADVNFLIALRKAQLINYNANAQRTMQRVIKGDKEIFKITLNQKAVKEIKDSMIQGNFIPNTITLNMPETTDWTYDSKRNILTINSLPAFDISDGYHRYMAMCQIKEDNPDFNYPVELRIISFPDDKVKQFIFQEDQKTKMRKVDSASMNMSSPANIVCERLNMDAMFDLKGQVRRNGGYINFSFLANIIDFIYFKNDKDRSMERIIGIKDALKNGINTYVEATNSFTHEFSFKELLILVYGISQNWDTETIKGKMERIDELDKRTFATQVTKKSMLNAIKKL